MKDQEKEAFSVNVSLLSHTNLVEVIKQLEDSHHISLRKRAQNELVKRLKEKGFNNKKIAMILVSNVYGARKKSAIAKEWADALGITKDEFLKLIDWK